MLTSFLEKTRPAVSLSVAIFTSLIFITHNILSLRAIPDILQLLTILGLLALLIFCVFLVDFIVRRNKMTENSALPLVIFAAYLAAFPQTFTEPNVLIATALTLLALRRVISLRSQLDIQKKIFDAALWTALASCAYFWSVLFFLPLYAGVAMYGRNNYRNYLIPFAGIGAVIILANSYTLLIGDRFFAPWDWMEMPGFDFLHYNDWSLLVPVSVITAIVLWTGSHYFLTLKDARKKHVPGIWLTLTCLFTGLAVILAVGEKNGSEWIFTGFPFSVMLGNYILGKGDRVFREGLLWGVIACSLVASF